MIVEYSQDFGVFALFAMLEYLTVAMQLKYVGLLLLEGCMSNMHFATGSVSMRVDYD